MKMCRVWNPTEERVATRIHGDWFSFAPNTQKTMDISKGEFINMNRQETGLVVLPSEFDPSSESYVENYEKTEAGKKVMAEKREEGIRNLIEFHMGIIRNNQVMLRQDLAQQFPSGDASKLAALYASKGEQESMRLVAKYKGKASDNAQKKMEDVEKLMQQIGPVVV